MTIFEGSASRDDPLTDQFYRGASGGCSGSVPLTDVALNTKLMTKRQLINKNTLRLCALSISFCEAEATGSHARISSEEIECVCVDIGTSKGRGGCGAKFYFNFSGRRLVSSQKLLYLLQSIMSLA